MNGISLPFVGTCLASKSVSSRTVSLAGLLGLTVLAGLSSTPANACVICDNYLAVEVAREAANAAVQSAIQDARDRAMRNRMSYGGPSGFAEDDAFFDQYFGALGYDERPASKKLYLKAPPAQPAAPTWAIWGLGYGDHQKQTGTIAGVDIGNTTSTFGVVAGIDTTITMVGGNILVLGVNGGDLSSRNNTVLGVSTRTETPSVGVYAAYIMGGFSVDAAFNTGWANSNATAAGATLNTNTTSYNIAANANYRFNNPGSWWVEPTAGLSHADDDDRTLGVPSVLTWRWQAGARWGTDTMWNGIRVEPTLGLYAFSDFSIEGIPAGAPTTEGKVWAKGTAKLNFIFANNFSAGIEGEIRGTGGIVGYAGRLNARLAF
jgi:Autotransporter beta-domain